MNKSNDQNIFRQIPGVDQLLLRPKIASWVAGTSREFVVSEIQKMLRHQRPTTTDRYLEGLSPVMKKVADILDEPKSTNLRVADKQ